MSPYQHEIKGLHHNAYRCRDSEETREFYEGVLGLRLANGFALKATKTGRPIEAFHSFYELDDGSFLAFFEVIDNGVDDFVFDQKSDFDLHIALAVSDRETLLSFKERVLAHSIEVRGPVDHEICHSIYVRDPNGYVIELASPGDNCDLLMQNANRVAHAQLADWQQNKHRSRRIL